MGLDVYLRFFMALAVTVGLLALVYALARRYGGQFGLVRGGGRGRLAVTAQIALDTRRRLVLVRRDDREHLLLLGPNNDVVIEQGIAGPPPSFQQEVAAIEGAGTPAASTEGRSAE